MRRADLDVAWEKCRSDRRGLCLESVAVIHGTTSFVIDLPSRITAIVGPNGAGKTRLLSEMASLLDARREHARVRIDGASGIFRGRPLGEGEEHPAALEIDVSSAAHQAQRFFREQTELGELLEGYEEKRLSEEELSRVRYVCGKYYTAVGIREIEAPTLITPQHADETEDEEEVEAVFPFFSVECDGLTYNSLSMGFGELCAFTVLWWLARAPRASFLLLDEPDGHLSPSSRSALIDLIALEASENNHVALFSTHSAESISKLAENEMITFGDGVRRNWLTSAPQRRKLLRSLGVCHPVKILIAVEDVDGIEVARQCLNRWGAGLTECFDVQRIVGGENELVQFVARFPSEGSIRVQGILDGDMRARHAHARAIDFFPGNKDPVAAARERFGELSQTFADALGIEVSTLTAAHEAVAHVDHHDYLRALIGALGINATVAIVRTALFASWLRLSDVTTEGSGLVNRLLAKLEALPI